MGRVDQMWWQILGIRLLNLTSGLFMVVCTASWLGPSGRGEVSLFLSHGFFLYLAGQFSGGAALGYFSSRHAPRSLFFLALKGAMAIVLVGGGLTFFMDLGWVISLSAILLALFLTAGGLAQHLLMGQNKQREVNQLLLIQNAGPLVLFSFGFWIFPEGDVKIFIVATLLAQLSYAVHAWNKMQILVPNNTVHKSEVIRQIWKMGFLAQLGNLLQFMQYRSCLFLLAYWETKAWVGVLSVVLALGEGLWIPARSGAQLLLGRIMGNHELPGRGSMLRNMGLALGIALLGSLILSAIPLSTYLWFLGQEYKPLKEVFVLIFPGIVIFSIQFSITHYFSGQGKYFQNMLASGLGLAVQWAFSWGAYPIMGFKAVMLGLSLGYVTGTLVSMWFYITEIPVKKT